MFGLDITTFVIMTTGTVLLAVWILLYIKGLRSGSMFNVLDDKKYRFKELYGIGLAALDLIRYKYKSEKDRALRQKLEILCGEKYSEYYLRVVRAQQVSLSFTVLILAFVFYGLSQEIGALIICIMFAVLAFYYFGTLPAKELEERSAELLRDFSEVVANLALLTNAGMILHEAWIETSTAGNSVIYKEMQTSVDEMSSGVSDMDAIFNFGSRCMIPEVKKFTSTIIQGMTMGNRELAAMLQEQSKEVWQMKKQLVRREGEKAASKMLIPICIMFLGILVLLLVPIFTNLGM